MQEAHRKLENEQRQKDQESWVVEACSGGAAKTLWFVNRLAGASLAGEGLSSDLRLIVRAHSEGWVKVWSGEGHDTAGDEATSW